MDPHISIQVIDPSAPVNPFASTASPSSVVNPFATTNKPVIAHMPSEPPPVMATPVSPLAASASVSDRNAYDEIMAGVEAETKARQKKPGTQMMTNAPARPATPAPAKKPVARTVAMGNWSPAKKPASAPAQSVAAPSAPPPAQSAALPAPSTPKMPVSVAAPSAAASSAVGSTPAASSGHGQPSYPQSPAGPGGWGWNAPPRPVVPGARVTVTWSNGQRYPATVNQINGSRCLVVFPDGQQHWVESQFVSAT